MRNRYLLLIPILCCFLFKKSYSQISAYSFASSTGTFSTIIGGAGTVVLATTGDDENYGTLPIGFTFVYNGNNYTSFGLNANGFISLGYVPLTTNNALSSGLNNNIISAFNNDLYGIDPNAKISYQLSGNTGNKVLTVEWSIWGFFNTGGNEFNFQIKLFEGTNKIQIVYGSCPGNGSKTLQVGLRGASNADFNNRTTTSNWSSTSSGTVNNANCTYSSSIKPATGLTFEWTPPASAPRTLGALTVIQLTGTAAPATSANSILRIDLPVTGVTGNLTLSSLTVTSKNTNDADVAGSGVKLWVGTSAAPTTQIGSSVSFSGGNAVFSSINTNLITGTNYIWITFDIHNAAVIGNILDAKINTGHIVITASGGALNPGTQPASNQNPSGNKTINYCSPFSTNGGCVGDEIVGFTFAGINYTAGNCISSPGYLDVATTGSGIQGQPYTFNITTGDIGDWVSLWIDYNDNASFDDAGEWIYTAGPGTSFTGVCVIPATAIVGTHRIRIRTNYDAAPVSSCGNQSFGETKDFRINISAATPCSGVPSSSNTISSANPVCSDAGFTLSLSTVYLNLGIEYQWQSSATGSNYSNIQGATSYSYTGSLTSATYYRCKVKCTNTNNSTFSTPVQVTVNSFLNCYCVPTGTDCTSGDNIKSVSFGGISNNNSGCSANGFGDFTNLTANTSQSAAQAISITVSNGGTEAVSAWIDYNHNSVFETSEKTFLGSAFNSPINSTINIPYNALPGITRMRLRLQFAFEPNDACEIYEYGETEDYLVNIAPCTSVIWYADTDADTYGSAVNTVMACVQPSGYVSNNLDCNDNLTAVHPGAAEVCNGLDDDCDSQVDEGFTLYTYYPDSDNDNFGNGGVPTLSCQSTPPTGFTINNTDCNDNNSGIYPGASESCNSLDDDCDIQIDEGLTLYIYYLDSDNDAFGNPASSLTTCQVSLPTGYASNNTDCNDANSNIHPGAIEICNDIDDNCNIEIDDNAVIANINPSGTISICAGSTILLKSDTGEGYSYQWLNNNVPIEGATSPSYDANSSGTYQVVVTLGSCSETSPITTVTVNSLPPANISPSGTIQVCPGVIVNLQANTGAGLSYQWSNLSGNIAGATNSAYSTTVPGTYKVTVTNNNNCSKTSNGRVVKNYTAATTKITASGSLNICTTGSVTLNAKIKNGYTYQWYKDDLAIAGATGTSYVATEAGTYKYLATTSNGCTAFSGSKLVKDCKVEGPSSHENAAAYLNVYPNPAQDVINIDLNSASLFSGRATMVLVNVLGEKVFEQVTNMSEGKLAMSISLDDQIAAGVYVVRVITGSNEAFTSPIVIAR